MNKKEGDIYKEYNNELISSINQCSIELINIGVKKDILELKKEIINLLDLDKNEVNQF